MRLLSFVFALVFLGQFSAFAKEDPRPEMHILAQEIANIQKFILSDASFSAPENAPKIQQSLDKLNEHLKKLEEKKFDPSLTVNLQMLSSHMADAQKYFHSGNKAFSRFMLQSSLQMCISCHTRGKSEVDFALPDVAKDADPMDQADFLFATRQFEKGRSIYEKLIEEYPGNKLNIYRLRKALLSLAVYYARVKEDPKHGATYFDEVAKHKIPVYLQKEAQAWASDFRAWSKEKTSKKAASEVELMKQVKRLLKSDDFSLVADNDRKFHIRRLRASALLHTILESEGASPIKGEALYYLGQIYHRISHQLFFRFGEMYLKACIMEYKKTKIAKECYNALEADLMEGYTGSGGTNVPQEEEVELFRLKRMAY